MASIQRVSDTTEQITREPGILGVIARGAGLTFIGFIALRISKYLLSILVAKEIGAAGLGLYNLGWATLSIAYLFAMVGFDQGGLRYMARYRSLGDQKSQRQLVRSLITVVLFLGLVTSSIFYTQSSHLANLFSENRSELVILFKWFALGIPFMALLIVLSSMSDGQRRIELGVLSRNIVQPFLAFILSWLFLSLNGNINDVVIATILSLIIACFVALLTFRKTILSKEKEYFLPLPQLREIILFSLPFLPMMLIREAESRMEIYLLGFFSTASDVGIFSAAINTAAFVSFGLSVTTRIYSTIASELHSSKEYKKLESILQTTTNWSISLSIPILIVFCVLGSDILSIFGEDFVIQGIYVLVLLSIAQFVNAATGPAGITLTMSGHSIIVLLNNLGYLIFGALIDWWLISNYGLIGAAIGGALTITILNIAYMIEAKLILGVQSFNRDSLRPIFAGIISILFFIPVIFVVSPSNLFIRIVSRIIILGLIYSCSWWLMASATDRSTVASILKKIQLR